MSTTQLMELTIDDRAYNYAKIYSSLLSDEYQRKRSYACLVALYAFLNLIEQTPYKIQKSMTLFRNPQVNEQYEVSDLYINNWHLDVRVITDGDVALVPKIHYESNIVPDFYVIVKVDKELKHAELVGLADMSEDKHEAFDYNYNAIPLSSLISYDEFLDKVQKEKTKEFTENDHKIFDEFYLNFMDSNIGEQSKKDLLKHLFECNDCRTEFCCFTGFEMVSCNASKYPELFDDQTLGIIGAQNVDDKKYEGKEETIDISDGTAELTEEQNATTDIPVQNLTTDTNIKEDASDNDMAFLDEIVEASNESAITEAANIVENTDNSVKEEGEQTVSDILNELFSEDETYIDNSDDSEKSVEIPNPEPVEIQDNILEDEIVETEIKDDALIDFNDGEELNIIDDEKSKETAAVYDIIDNIAEETPVNEDEGLVLINDDSSDIEFLDDTKENNVEATVEEIGTETQKVIVDYDETGEPIYSYITNIEDATSSAPDDYSETPTFEEIEDNIIDDKEIQQIETAEDRVSDALEDIANDDLKQDFVQDTENLAENITNIAEDALNIVPQASQEEIEEIKDDYTEDDKFYDDEKNEENVTDTEETTEEPADMKEDDKEYNEEENNEKDSEENEEYEDSEEDSEDEYEDGEEYDDEYEEGDDVPPEGRKSSIGKLIGIIIGILVLLGLLGGGAFFFLNKNKSAPTPQQTENIQQPQNEQQNQQNDMFGDGQENNSGEFVEGEGNPEEQNNEEQPQEENYDEGQQEGNPDEQPQEGQLTEGDLIPPENNNEEQAESAEGNINKVIVNSFNQNRSGISLRELNWFCTTELFTDKVFKNYLQNLDNTLKQNLRNNFMNVTETPGNDSVAAKFAVDNNGNLKKVMISTSSGSEQIDNIVLQSINETFAGEKSQILNEGSLKSDMYLLKVVIKI